MEPRTLSVLMSVYKEPIDWLCQSVDSILQQTFTDYEFIIISDNPLYAEGNSLLKDYAEKDSRIVLILNEENIGLTKSLNKGLAIAKGEYIARMDADDISMPERFQKQIAFLEGHPEVDVCGSNFTFFGSVSFFSNKKGDRPTTNDEIVAYMACKNPIAHPTVMMKRVIGGSSYQYDESVSKAQDYKLWYDLYKKGAVFYNLKERLLYYRISSSQITNTANGLQNNTANYVRSQMLDERGRVSDCEKSIHNEVFNATTTEYSLTDKLNWIQSLLNEASTYPKGPYKSLLWLYYVKTCLHHNNLISIIKQRKEIFVNLKYNTLIRLFIPYIKRRMLGS